MRLANWKEFANEETGQPGACYVCRAPLLSGQELCNHKGDGMHLDCFQAANEHYTERDRS